MTRPGLRLTFVLFGCCFVAACYGPPVPPAPRLPWEPPAVLDTVSRGSLVRFILEDREFTGTLRLVTTDSFTIDRAGRDMTIARAALDTVWVRGGRRYQGTATGIGLGLTAAALIVLTKGGVEDPYRGHFAVLVGLLLVGFGALGDVVTAPKWTPIPLGWQPSSPEAGESTPGPSDLQVEGTLRRGAP